jgi:hypothetical protein
MRDEFDWNKQHIWNADGDDVPLTDDDAGLGYDVQVHNDITEVATITGNLEGALCRWIENADFLFCCFAWFTNHRVLDAMADLKHGCCVVVQKEDFLRPDSGHTSSSNVVLRQKYAKLRTQWRLDLPGIAGSLSMSTGCEGDAVRCAGVSNTDRRQAVPRMHHKFAVACKVFMRQHDMVDYQQDYPEFHPYSTWTGSFNPTINGTRSRENAVVIESKTVSRRYLKEWERVFAMSEPLDWSSEWCSPEWRIGT